ncbi:MAG: DUF6065 family protein [Pseudaminobacter sp.]
MWSQGRNTFNTSLADPASQAAQDQWQKTYFRGKAPSGAPAPEGHCSRLRLRPFAKNEGVEPAMAERAHFARYPQKLACRQSPGR